MAATAAVESEIDRHYGAQETEIGTQDSELAAHIVDFRGDEAEHRATALDHEAEQAFGYPLFEATVRVGCRVAIAFSERF